MTGIEQVAETVRAALVEISGATVSEQSVEGDATSFDVQVGDDNVNVTIGGPVSA
jgi:hypothetical protein